MFRAVVLLRIVNELSEKAAKRAKGSLEGIHDISRLAGDIEGFPMAGLMQATHNHNEMNVTPVEKKTDVADVIGLVVTALLVVSAVSALVPDALGHLGVYIARVF